jgi:phosphoserine phosphatase RsbX
LAVKQAFAHARQRLAAGVINGAAAEPLDVLFGLCHRQLATTRGAAMTLARLDFGDETLQWMGVGNVVANLLAKSPSGVETRSSARLAGGIAEGHLDGVDFTAPAAVIAERILREDSMETDDALVLVARHRGISP